MGAGGCTYTTRSPDPEIQCLSVATADEPAGPYADESDRPLVCQSDEGGSIDASPFLDSDGTAWLYWKNDGNAVAADTWIYVQRLSADGLELVGPRRRLFKQTLAWEGELVEAPFVWRDGEGDRSRYHLFYSANDFGSVDYAVGHAVSDAPTGPFRKDDDPVLASNDVAAGPGHCSLFRAGGEVWMSYHAWPPDAVGDEATGRQMWLSPVTFGPDSTVRVGPPTTQAQPAP